MARPDQSVHPIEAFRGAVTALEAAVLMCLAKPDKKAVHGLRTAARRVEAQIELLSFLRKLPSHKRPREKLLHLLKKLSRAAGKVRDIDVQRRLIDDEARKNESHPGPGMQLREEAKALRKHLNRKRAEFVNGLVKVLHKQQTELPPVVEEMLAALAPAESRTLNGNRLAALVQDWYIQPTRSRPASDDTTHFHAVRKRAKIARYLAESAPASVSAQRIAVRFEKAQHAGGKWHDWLLLTGVAAAKLGDGSALPARFAARTERSLRSFRSQLRDLAEI